MKVLVTGVAGFIGFHMASKLLNNGISVIGLDNLNSYYDVNLKNARLINLIQLSKELNIKFEFDQVDIIDNHTLEDIFKNKKPDKVIHLAAQAGVRYSIENPRSYIDSNLVGFSNILEECRKNKISHLIYASSSSVYGGNVNLPFNENDGVDHPVSLYAATKKANELMAHSYSHLYNIPCTGLRFFTVYGPWGRPDMALFLFTKAILDKKPIKVFNMGDMIRDFTFIDDIIESMFRLLDKEPLPNINFDKLNPTPSTSWAPFRIFNIGNSKPTPLLEYISALENALKLSSEKIFLEMQPGDVKSTSADTSSLSEWIGFKPSTPIQEGINKFVSWYRDFYKI